jgi:hypothetical protein
VSRWGRAAAVVLVLVSVLLGLPPTTAGADTAPAPTATRVLVVGVPGLTWGEIDPKGTPELWSLAQSSAIGAVSVRAVRSRTCVLDGWATLGAGNRVKVPGPDATTAPAPPPLTFCGSQQRMASSVPFDPVAAVRRTAAAPGTTRYGGEPGALGAAVGCANVVGKATALAAAGPRVKLTQRDSLPTDPTALSSLLSGCRLSLISLDQLIAAGRPGSHSTVTGVDPAQRSAALKGVDDAVRNVRAAAARLPGNTLLLLQGVSEVNDGRAALHVGIASGPGYTGAQWLTSANTGRAPYVELIDVAPTALQALGINTPPSMNGQPWEASGRRPGLTEAVAQLNDANTAATVHYRHIRAFFWWLVIVVAVLVVLGIVILGGWPRVRAPWAGNPRARQAVRTAALLVAALPVSTYLADLAPWQRSGLPGLTLVAVLAVADLVVAAVAGWGPWRRHPLGPAIVLLAITWATLVGDVLTGSHLELNGLLGYDAIVAGRFVGYGNLTFGLHAICALLITAAIATAVGRRSPDRERLLSGGVALLVGLVTVGIVGWPRLGRDFGGVLALLPGFLMLAMLLAHVRVTVTRMLAVVGAAVLAVGTVAFLDWLRPPGQRSHLGRFVEQILTGEAWTVVSRKGQANLSILLGSPLSWMLLVAVLAAFWLLRAGGPLSSRDGIGPGGLDARDTAVLKAGLIAVLVSEVLGSLVNDSGVAIAATGAALLVPLMIWLAAGAGRGVTATGEESGGAPHSDPVEGADRVTVVSRGSTVWNT